MGRIECSVDRHAKYDGLSNEQVELKLGEMAANDEKLKPYLPFHKGGKTRTVVTQFPEPGAKVRYNAPVILTLETFLRHRRAPSKQAERRLLKEVDAENDLHR